jgi:hypothetical protein
MGILSRVSHNKVPTEVPTTLMRAWLDESRYTSVLNNPAPDATSAELQGIAELLDGRKPKEVQGTVMLGEVDRSQNSNKLGKPVA